METLETHLVCEFLTHFTQMATLATQWKRILDSVLPIKSQLYKGFVAYWKRWKRIFL